MREKHILVSGVIKIQIRIHCAKKIGNQFRKAILEYYYLPRLKAFCTKSSMVFLRSVPASIAFRCNLHHYDLNNIWINAIQLLLKASVGSCLKCDPDPEAIVLKYRNQNAMSRTVPFKCFLYLNSLK